MAQVQPIRILHLTDTHIQESSKEQIRQRVNSLTKYINENKYEIDLVVFTGDLTFSGKANEFELFEEIVASPIRKQLKIHDSKFLIIPGNHDVDRSCIAMDSHSKLRKFKLPLEAEEELENIATPWRRLEAFQNYHQNHYPSDLKFDHKSHCAGLYSTRRINNIRGVNLGFALFNSSWLCADDEDEGKLFLTEKQVRDAVDGLQQCDMRIALCHHPRDWFHESEKDLAVNDLRREFSLILTGHLHKPISVSEFDTTAHSVSFSSRALFDGKITADVDDGFHLYELRIPEKKVTVLFRKYIRKRNTFDKDTDHANDGKFECELPVPLSLRTSSALLVQRLSNEGEGLAKEVSATLARLQGTAKPVFVMPKVSSFRVKGGSRKTIKDELSFGELLESCTVVTGDRDSGKSILLKTLAAESGRILSDAGVGGAAVYLSVEESMNILEREQFINLVEEKIDQKGIEINGFKLVLIIDGISSKHSERLEIIHKACEDFGWRYIVSMAGFRVVDILAQDKKYSAVRFAEVKPWGPSRIREFTLKLFEGTKVNPNLAFKTICHCLRTADIPANPTIISLYVSVFSTIGSKISTLSFLRLLEKIEQMRLGFDEPGSVDSLYNRQKILILMAVECHNRGEIVVPEDFFIELVEGYFRPKKLKVNNQDFTEFLIKSGILRKDGNTISFSNYVFFDYYLALAFREKMLDEKEFTLGIRKCAIVASALSLFAGMQRENVELARRVMSSVEDSFLPMGELRLADLDRHINGMLLNEKRTQHQVDEVTQEALEEKEDLAQMDQDYELQRNEVARTREKLMKQGLDESFSDLSLKIQGLHAFYSIFRNLENIDGDLKEKYLDRILDFHVATNFFLIDFYVQFSPDESFRTYAAYMLTWTGHTFMASSLGNPTMCDTIIEVMNRTDNDFKELLLILLVSELGDDRAPDLITTFLDNCESRAATEILFMHVRNRLVEHQTRNLPVKLVSVFKELFTKRQTKFGGAKTGAEALNKFGEAMSKIKVEHWNSLKEKGIDENFGGDEEGIIDI